MISRCRVCGLEQEQEQEEQGGSISRNEEAECAAGKRSNRETRVEEMHEYKQNFIKLNGFKMKGMWAGD